MTYMTTGQAAEKWGLTANRVYALAKNGRIPDSVQIGSRWMIPANACKPIDGRTKAARAKKSDHINVFRYPDFSFKVPAAFDPPLSPEELQLKAAEEAFYACRFDEAEQLLGNPMKKPENQICRIYALYMHCLINILKGSIAQFFDYYNQLSAEMKEDFPHKQEMAFLLPELNAGLGAHGYFRDVFTNRSAYDYHESFLPHLAALSAVTLSFSDIKQQPSGALVSCELNSIFLKHSECWADLQTLHLYLAMAFYLSGKESEAKAHLRKVLILAEQYELWYIPATEYYTIKDLYVSVLPEFSQKTTERLVCFGEELRRRNQFFMKALSKKHIFWLMNSNDFPYILYAAQGYTNEVIAGLLHKQPSAVGMRFNKIYNQLGVNSKKELVALYEKSINAVPLP